MVEIVSARIRPFRIYGVAVGALLAALGAARAADDGLPGDAAASAVLVTDASAPAIDLTPVGATGTTATIVIAPQLPPDIPPASFDAAATSVAERLPFALDALMAGKGRLEALGAGDWRAAREAVRSLYVSRAFLPIWTESGQLNAAGRSLLARLNHADEDGLSLRGLDLPEDTRAAFSREREVDVEIGLSTAAVVYALEASGARILPRSISPEATPKIAVVDPLAALTDLAVAPDPGERLQDFNPPQPGYRNLREKLADLLSDRPAAVAEALTPGYARWKADARPSTHGRGGRFAAAVPAPATSVSFDSGVTGELRAKIEANMEMWRWEPRILGANRVEINIPDYMLRLYQNDRQTDEMRVIVGKPDAQTPVFSNEIRYLLVNPIWRVPQSIVQKEMLPKAGGDPSYFEQHGFKVKMVGGQIFVEQPPGEGNALGHLLFMFPNEHAVYLHDTPAHALFGTAKRAYSHGCVRVEAPLRLASEVMGGEEAGWSEDKVEGMFGSTERWVFLPSRLPIHIEYFTAFVDDDGALQERGDIYGLTSKVAFSLSRLSQD
jgi:L,D-transpeptidase YcbB